MPLKVHSLRFSCTDPIVKFFSYTTRLRQEIFVSSLGAVKFAVININQPKEFNHA